MNRVDAQADATSMPADPEAALEAFKETCDGMLAAIENDDVSDPVA